MDFNPNLAETKHVSLFVATPAIYEVIYRLYMTTLFNLFRREHIEEFLLRNTIQAVPMKELEKIKRAKK